MSAGFRGPTPAKTRWEYVIIIVVHGNVMPGKRTYIGGVGLLMASGSASSLVGKILYAVKGPDLGGHSKAFGKPWFAALLMFLGMSICLPCSWLYRLVFRLGDAPSQGGYGVLSHDESEQGQDAAHLRETESTWSLAEIAESTKAWWRRYDAVLFPTLFDLFASALLGIGLLFTTVSVYQMVRGTEILFTAALSALVLHRKLNRQNLWGLALCLTGILLVGASSVMTSDKQDLFLTEKSSPSARDTLLGMLLIVIAEAVQASQVVAEDWLMSTADTKLPPVEVVGYEGLFGTVLMALIVLPLLQFSSLGREGGGLREDTLESLHMMVHSPPVAVAAASYVILMALYNLSGMLVTDSMGALSRTVAETARTLLVWGLDLFLYYKVHIKGATSIGEPWTSYSWLQALGFVVLVFGTALYAVGEEKHAKELRDKLKRRARDEWSLLRASVGRLIDLSRRHAMTQDERQTPTRPARIAGPARIRVALGLLQARNSRMPHRSDSCQPPIGRLVHHTEEQLPSAVGGEDEP